ncbi:alpha-amylase/4-alpha-glucanotransferase domain-containing protein [uncultured Brachyspira sp.]|uniref:alpha-amylase/4-alpha-glucanotransferase domain-containing protein n=1 Tax=uncultured Brachyspira sp. TaxID=221953 RepID=UPI002608808E|nr:alpha-amylase/4-alpha-glucanotransferase domain-containing protein [uncultured Brachyspira sp.]
MKTINLILGNHNHQPVGNFDFVFESTYQKAYKPFLDILAKYKDIKFNFHYTGCLLEWIEKNHPEHIEALKKLSDEKRIEFQSGGFYEPIMPSIPDKDKDIQIDRLNKYIYSRFNCVPQGAWIAERVWEPTLVKNLAMNGLKYLMLDDSQFLTTGIDTKNMFGYFITDNENYKLNIFPISQELRYLIPFRDVEKSIEYLKSIATEEGDRVVVLHDDGEKYGDWPGTQKWVYEDKWLEKFFEALTKEKDTIITTTYSEYMEKYPPVSKIYIPTGSYEEMLTWVLPAEIQDEFHRKQEELKKSEENEIITRFMRGGFWRNYFTKYTESNRMNKRMLFVSNMIGEITESNYKDKEEALNYLLKGQCNCPYWHGTFGGLYLNNLRHATYANLIKATSISLEKVYGREYFLSHHLDFDMDGREEVIISCERSAIIFHRLSGSIIEWDLKKDTPINLIDCLKRREEAYHIAAMRNAANEDNNDSEHVSIHEIAKKVDEKIAKYLVFDKNEKVFAVDHFLNKIPTAEEFQLMKYEEDADFYKSYYNVVENLINKDYATISYDKVSKVNGKDIYLMKRYVIDKDGTFTLESIIQNKSNEDAEFVYALENNITLLAGQEPDRYYIGDDKKISSNLCEASEYKGKSIGMVDEGYVKVKVSLEANEETTFLYMPNYTISDAVDKLEMNYQNSTIVCCKKINLKPGEKVQYKIKVTAKDI